MIVSDKDIGWLRESYPQLAINLNTKVMELKGEFHFNAVWDEIGKQYIINPDEASISKFIHIIDSYDVKILIPQNNENPIVYEVAGRIKSNAIKRGKHLSDLHIYESGEICCTGQYDIAGIKNLSHLLDGPVLQYFYDQSYYDKYGRWPRGEYSHGTFGRIENLYIKDVDERDIYVNDCLKMILDGKSAESILCKNIILKKEKPQGHHQCLCGSNKEFRGCHNNLFRGLWLLHQHYHTNK